MQNSKTLIQKLKHPVKGGTKLKPLTGCFALFLGVLVCRSGAPTPANIEGNANLKKPGRSAVDGTLMALSGLALPPSPLRWRGVIWERYSVEVTRLLFLTMFFALRGRVFVT